MEAPPSAAVVNVDPVWQKKRSFWSRNIAVSGTLMIVVPVAVVFIPILEMNAAFGPQIPADADLGELSTKVDRVMQAFVVGGLIGLVAFIWVAIATVKLCMLGPLAVTPEAAP